MELCWKRRPIEAVELDGAPGELVAVINDDRLTPDPMHGRARRMGALAEVVAQCHRCAPPLVAALLRRWPELPTTERTDAWYHVLDALVAREAIRDPSHAAAQARGFSGVEGVPLSLAQLMEAYAKHDCVYVLPAPWSRWGPSLLPPDRAVVCADPYEQSVLRSLFPNVKDVQASWNKWREQERARERSAAPRASKAIGEPRPTPRVEPEPGPGLELGIDPTSALRHSTPEERLVEALRAELSRVRERNDTLLCDEHLERIRVVPLPRKRRALVAWADAEGVTVNRMHPVVERAIAEPDPVWHAYLCSAIYTAINVWLEEITDADEQRFLACFAELAASGV